MQHMKALTISNDPDSSIISKCMGPYNSFPVNNFQNEWFIEYALENTGTLAPLRTTL